jgi:hypothetical protein
MAKKTVECTSYSIAALRNANKSLIDIVEDINSKAVEISVKSLTNGVAMDYTELAGLFRVYELVQNRFDSAVNSYTRHQDSHLCDIPDDISDIF